MKAKSHCRPAPALPARRRMRRLRLADTGRQSDGGITAAPGTGKPADDRFLGAQADLSANVPRRSGRKPRRKRASSPLLSIQLCADDDRQRRRGRNPPRDGSAARRRHSARHAQRVPFGLRGRAPVRRGIQARARQLDLASRYAHAARGEGLCRPTPTTTARRSTRPPSTGRRCGHQRMGPAEHRREHRPRSGGASPDEARLYLINTLSFDAEWEAG